MKITFADAQKNLIRYVDNEMINHLEGWKKIVTGAGLTLIIKNLPETIEKYKDNTLFGMLGIVDGDGNIDIDVLHDATANYFTEQGEYIDIPIIGRAKVTRNDIETLYAYLKG